MTDPLAAELARTRAELRRAEDELAVYRAKEAARRTVDDPLLEPADLAAQHGRQIAYRIRAELVCCRIFHRVQVGEVSHGRIGNHDICYWGEASALIAETPEQWRNDPPDHDWGEPLVPKPRKRRERRGQRQMDNQIDNQMHKAEVVELPELRAVESMAATVEAKWAHGHSELVDDCQLCRHEFAEFYRWYHQQREGQP